MRYVEARLEQYVREETYRIYITDTLYYHEQGQHLTERYAEKLSQKKPDNRTGDEIALDIIKGAGLTLEGS